LYEEERFRDRAQRFNFGSEAVRSVKRRFMITGRERMAGPEEQLFFLGEAYEKSGMKGTLTAALSQQGDP
jgi:hypothetical protein